MYELVPPTKDAPGKLAWRAWQDGSKKESSDVYHAWLVEELKHGRVRILTEESQIGELAAELAAKKSMVMIIGLQDVGIPAWIDKTIYYSILTMYLVVGWTCTRVQIENMTDWHDLREP